jgi:LmbE family N-acetylglucosaminyl deacetylase
VLALAELTKRTTRGVWPARLAPGDCALEDARLPTVQLSKTHLFLLPHQDDEFGIFHLIDRILEIGEKVKIVYLTDGAHGRSDAITRNAESRKVLTRLGVPVEQVIWLGTDLQIPNLRLRFHLKRAHDALCDVLEGIEQIVSMFTPAWEGGHPDHDAAALLAVALARNLGVTRALRQFPLYSAYRCRWRPYRVLTPIEEAGLITTELIPIGRRIQHLALCGMYRSQRKTFLALFPLIMAHYGTEGTQQYQYLNANIVAARPHQGPLLYERRGWTSWTEFEQDIGSFRAHHRI